MKTRINCMKLYISLVSNNRMRQVRHLGQLRAIFLKKGVKRCETSYFLDTCHTFSGKQEMKVPTVPQKKQ